MKYGGERRKGQREGGRKGERGGKKRGEGMELATRSNFIPSISALTPPREYHIGPKESWSSELTLKKAQYLVTVGKQVLWLP